MAQALRVGAVGRRQDCKAAAPGRIHQERAIRERPVPEWDRGKQDRNRVANKGVVLDRQPVNGNSEAPVYGLAPVADGVTGFL